MPAAASRASFSNSRPIVGRRSCRKWVLSNSVVTSAIGMVLSEGARTGCTGPDVEPGDPDQAKNTLTGLVVGGAAQELVEAAQVGERDVDLGRGGRLGDGRRDRRVGGLDRGQRPASAGSTASALIERARAGRPRSPRATRASGCSPSSCRTRTNRRAPAVAPCCPLQRGAEAGEARGELPVAEHRRVVQRAGLAVQRRQVVERVEDHRRASPSDRSWVATTWPSRHDHDAVDVALDRHHLERERPGHAVAVAVEGDGLILVDGDRGVDHAGVEPMRGQRRRRGEVLGEAVLDRRTGRRATARPARARPRSACERTCSTRRGRRRGARAWRTAAARP